MPEVKQHPALAHKYRVVQYTRGIGIEVGEGITSESEPLYPHFRKIGAVVAQGDAALGALDFILICGAAPLPPVGPYIKVGGYLVWCDGPTLRIMKREPDIADTLTWSDVDLTIPGPSVCVCRYGGFGDMVQSANIFPALKRQGFKVYVMTTPKGMDVIAHDPHVDGFLIQDTDQVPNAELPAYWDVQAERFDRFVNLSESVEGTLLAYEGRANHRWPMELRRQMLGHINYLEFTSALAEVPYASETRFYPTDAERAAVQRFLAATRRRAAGVPHLGPTNAPETFNIMFALSGSSAHKMYPHQDEVIASVLRSFPEATFTLVGDEACRLLETGWEDHNRIRCTSGQIGIRETLALAQAMDCVIGPETGVLNAVGFEPMGKVILLSHSSPRNLTLHWVNTEAIEPPTKCYPCHQLHTGRKHCPEHEPTGASLCAFEIDPFRVFSAIGRVYAEWKRLRELRPACSSPT